jgi:pyruvate formate lyase activating enzyme
MEVDRLMDTLLKDMHFYEESGGGVTFSGGEPLMQPESLLELLEACKMHGIHTTVDTCGYAKQERFERILPLTDLFLFDLKHMDPALHKKHTGVDNALILSNAIFLLEQEARVIFRIPVIPGINTTSTEVDAMIGFLDGQAEKMKEIHLLPYHRIAGNKYRKLQMEQHLDHVAEPDEQMMHQLKEEFMKTGLEVIIGG